VERLKGALSGRKFFGDEGRKSGFKTYRKGFILLDAVLHSLRSSVINYKDKMMSKFCEKLE
jgi:hypothetical protein